VNITQYPVLTTVQIDWALVLLQGLLAAVWLVGLIISIRRHDLPRTQRQLFAASFALSLLAAISGVALPLSLLLLYKNAAANEAFINTVFDLSFGLPYLMVISQPLMLYAIFGRFKTSEI